jgi:hypothetical protein
LAVCEPFEHCKITALLRAAGCALEIMKLGFALEA